MPGVLLRIKCALSQVPPLCTVRLLRSGSTEVRNQSLLVPESVMTTTVLIPQSCLVCDLPNELLASFYHAVSSLTPIVVASFA